MQPAKLWYVSAVQLRPWATESFTLLGLHSFLSSTQHQQSNCSPCKSKGQLNNVISWTMGQLKLSRRQCDCLLLLTINSIKTQLKFVGECHSTALQLTTVSQLLDTSSYNRSQLQLSLMPFFIFYNFKTRCRIQRALVL